MVKTPFDVYTNEDVTFLDLVRNHIHAFLFELGAQNVLVDVSAVQHHPQLFSLLGNHQKGHDTMSL